MGSGMDLSVSRSVEDLIYRASPLHDSVARSGSADGRRVTILRSSPKACYTATLPACAASAGQPSYPFPESPGANDGHQELAFRRRIHGGKAASVGGMREPDLGRGRRESYDGPRRAR